MSSAGACGWSLVSSCLYGLDVYNVNQSIQLSDYSADIGSYLKTADQRLIYTAYNWGMGSRQAD